MSIHGIVHVVLQTPWYDEALPIAATLASAVVAVIAGLALRASNKLNQETQEALAQAKLDAQEATYARLDARAPSVAVSVVYVSPILEEYNRDLGHRVYDAPDGAASDLFVGLWLRLQNAGSSVGMLDAPDRYSRVVSRVETSEGESIPYSRESLTQRIDPLDVLPIPIRPGVTTYLYVEVRGATSTWIQQMSDSVAAPSVRLRISDTFADGIEDEITIHAGGAYLKKLSDGSYEKMNDPVGRPVVDKTVRTYTLRNATTTPGASARGRRPRRC